MVPGGDERHALNALNALILNSAAAFLGAAMLTKVTGGSGRPLAAYAG